MPLSPRRSERSPFDTIVILFLERSGFGLLDTEKLIRADNNPPPVLELNDHFLGEDFLSENPALAMRRDHSRADGR
jgi:hypothetical protein